MRVRGLVAIAVAIACSLTLALSPGLAAAGRKQQANQPCGIVSAPVLRPRLLFTPPPVALTSILEVFRRARSGAAELPPGGVPFGYSAVWVNFVHLLATGPDKAHYFLIPGIIDAQLSAACLHSLSPSERYEYETQLHTGSVTLEAVKDEKETGAIPFTAQAIEAGRALLATLGGSNSKATISGVVPDGVASVTITAANGATATASVTNNLFLAELPASELKPLTVKWYSAGGSLVKTARIKHVPGSALLAPGGPTLITVPPPPTVVHAGGRKLAEFEQGRMVVAQSGCLACHRLGQNGNHGPGPGLTHIGSMLSKRSIEHALIDPSAPMPSFKHLPAAKFKAVVEFLSELR